MDYDGPYNPYIRGPPVSVRRRKLSSVRKPVRYNDFAPQYVTDEDYVFEEDLSMPRFFLLGLWSIPLLWLLWSLGSTESPVPLGEPSPSPNKTSPSSVYATTNGSPISLGLVPTKYRAVFGHMGLARLPANGSLDFLVPTGATDLGGVWFEPFAPQGSGCDIQEALRIPGKLKTTIAKLKPV